MKYDAIHHPSASIHFTTLYYQQDFDIIGLMVVKFFDLSELSNYEQSTSFETDDGPTVFEVL